MAQYGILTKKEKKIIQLLLSNKEGLRATIICKILAIPRRTIYNNLKKLEQRKLIKNVFPIWSLCQNQAESSKMAQLIGFNQLQSHKFSFVLRLLNKPVWWEKRENKLTRLNEFHFEPIKWGNNNYQQLNKDSFLIQTFSNSIVFINQKQYWGNDSYDCYIESLLDTLKMLNYVETKFKYKFFNNDIPQFSVRTQHYVKVIDEISKRCKKEKNMLKITIDGKLRAWTDLSDPYGIEFGHKNYAPEDTRWYKQFIDDGLRYQPPKLTEIMELMNELTTKTNLLAEYNKETAAGLNSVIKLIKTTNEVNKQNEEEIKHKPKYIG